MDSYSYTAEQPVAYFCAEFGLESRLPLYAGGLGILAGDTLRAAAQLQFPMVGVGLLYRGEDALQFVDDQGMQREEDIQFDPVSAELEHVYLDDQPLFVRVHLTEVAVWLRCWKKTIGKTVTLYLLDTETDQNHVNERMISHALYKGTEEVTLQQQMLLGIGGVKLLTALGIHPSVFHLQEGRPAFLHWQLIRQGMDHHGLSFAEAKENARQRTVYTNHTLVAAGNKQYQRSLVETYAAYYAERMGISIKQLLADGVESESSNFSVTAFALNTSRKASGVSELHTALSQKQWPQYNWVNVTNGVDLPFWQAPEIVQVRNGVAALWQGHVEQKYRLEKFIRERTGFGFDPNSLVITWARRLSGYKRFASLFEDVARLKVLVSQSDWPVQILLSGKAHYLDANAKQQLQAVIQLFQTELSGHTLYIPNYDIDVAQALVRGSDVWLNTPEMGMEASGTSGMKAISNGVLQCTVPDGWAHEVDWQGMGWVLESGKVTESMYTVLEKEILPLFYTRDATGVPQEWVARMQKSIALADKFSAVRMLQEYISKLYAG